MKLDNAKIIVTGAANGMGRHFALRLAEHGAQVAAGDVDASGLESLVEAAKGVPGRVHARRLDVTREDETETFAQFAFEAMGGLTGLVNNAGIIRDGLLVKKHRETGAITKMSASQWQSVIDVNLSGATLMVRDTVAKMVEEGQKGVVVNMSSIARHGNRGQTNYVAAKAALAANTRTWSLEWQRFGIRAGAVAPGMVETPMTSGMNQKALDQWVAQIPVGRIGQPEDIFLAVKFIIECDYFNGRTIDVDGGLSF
ncbi:MAG: SDR family oxidoreductase [Myxococcota bacterium]